MRPQDLPPLERMLTSVEKQPDGCWRWTGVIDRSGYGRVGHRGVRGVPAYRALYEEVIGPVPDGMALDHRCHTDDASCAGGSSCAHRRCVNPAHLEPVTHAENTARSVRARRTHCPQNHPYSGDNLRVSQGRRFCRACARLAAAASKAKAKAVVA